MPLPYGGKQRQIMVDLNPQLLYARHISPTDVSEALNAQNLILPAGTALKILSSSWFEPMPGSQTF